MFVICVHARIDLKCTTDVTTFSYFQQYLQPSTAIPLFTRTCESLNLAHIKKLPSYTIEAHDVSNVGLYLQYVLNCTDIKI